jgi:hypothetical protein
MLVSEPCYCGEVALRDLLPNEDASWADVTAERLGKAQKRARDTAFRGYQHIVSVAQPPRQ